MAGVSHKQRIILFTFIIFTYIKCDSEFVKTCAPNSNGVHVKNTNPLNSSQENIETRISGNEESPNVRIVEEFSYFNKENRTLNQVLNDFVREQVDDSFEDYPEIDYAELLRNATYASNTTNNTASDNSHRETGPAVSAGFQLIGYALELVNPCVSRNVLSMQRLIGLSVDKENYWDGLFHSDHFRNLKKVNLILDLVTTANVTAIRDNTEVTRINDTTYAIKGVNPSKSVEFNVQAPPGVGFPFVKKLTLNGREICKRRREWRPSLLGSGNQAVVSPLISPNQEGVYYCGRSKINFAPLVVKGLPTKEGDYPWHVALFTKNMDTKNWDYSCGGTILHRKTIITAAHCVIGKDGHVIDKKRLLVIAGKYRLFEVDSYQIPLKLKEIIVHHGYTNTHTNLTNDLALLILEDHLEYGQYIQPICQWNSKQEEKEIVYQEYGTVVGWGATENDTLSESLLAASLRVIPDNLCLKSRPSFFKRYITENTFCAGNKNGTSACNGDSGGGLIFPIKESDGKTSWYLRGVVSVGVRRSGGLCDPEHYVVFTDVVRYREWIEEHQQL